MNYAKIYTNENFPLYGTFFFQGTYTLSRKIVRNRDVSRYQIVCM